MKLNAASDLEHVYGEVSDALIEIELYAGAILDAFDGAQKDPLSNETKFKVSYEIEKLEGFFNNRAKVFQATGLAQKQLVKHGNILSSIPNARLNVQTINDLLTSLNDFLWPQIPYVNLEAKDFPSQFVLQVKVDEWQKLISKCKEVSDYMNGMSGMVGGQLKSSVVDFNIHSLLDLYRHIELIPDLMETLNKKD